MGNDPMGENLVFNFKSMTNFPYLYCNFKKKEKKENDDDDNNNESKEKKEDNSNEETVAKKSSPVVLLPPIGVLPFEILVHIFQYLIHRSNDVGKGFPAVILSRLGEVCKAWNCVAHSDELWGLVCSLFWPTIDKRVLQVECLRKFDGYWERMRLEKPHVRCDGVYISKNAYLRTGDGNSWWVVHY